MGNDSLIKKNNDVSKFKNEINESILQNIKSKFILQKIFNNLNRHNFLLIIKINNKLQKRLNIEINDYREYNDTYFPVEMEIKPFIFNYGKFINIPKNEESFYHIYFNKKEEVKKYSIDKYVSKIRIKIDCKANSFHKLFENCDCIESINFKRFKDNNITDMSFMFSQCSLLKKLDLSNFNTKNVINMSHMFYGCSSLKELNLSNFNTNKVLYMNGMFNNCSSLKRLNLQNFNTDNVLYMSYMFCECLSLEELDISNFNTNKVITTYNMFCKCFNLKKLKILSFDITNNKDKEGMFAYTRQISYKIEQNKINIIN